MGEEGGCAVVSGQERESKSYKRWGGREREGGCESNRERGGGVNKERDGMND